MGIQWRIVYRLCYELAMSAGVYFMKRVKDCDVSIMSPQDEQWRRTSLLFVHCNFLVLLSTTVLSKNINKQNVNIADETLTDYSFLSMYHYNKSKNYLKRRYRIRHWIPMFIGTPLYKTNSQHYLQNLSRKKWGKIFWLFILANCNIKRTPQIIQLRYQVYCYGRLSESPFRLFDTNTYNLQPPPLLSSP